MQIKKWVATGLSALMAGATLSAAALAAADLKDFPTNLASATTSASSLDAFIVVGTNAAAGDIVGASDVAARLAEVSYTVTSVPGTTSSNIDGIQKTTIGINAQLDSVMPDPVKNIHYSGLKKSIYSWRSNDYDYSEQISLGNIEFNHDFGTSNINGTEKLYVSADDVQYQWVADETLAGTGSATTLNYTHPVKIKLLGKEFQIVGAGSNSVVMLAGAIGTAIKEGSSTTGITTSDGAYTVYVTAGVNNDWATFQVKDKDGKVVDPSVTVTGEGNTQQASTSGLDVRLTDIRVAGTDPATQHIEADIVVGKTGQTQKTYTTSCDVTSVGTSDVKFSGTTDWCIKVSGFNNPGQLTSGDQVIVTYKPSDAPKYFDSINSGPGLAGTGSAIKLPNSYGEIGFEGWNTAKFVQLDIAPTEISAYNASDNSISLGSMKGIEVKASVPGSLINPHTNTGYERVYLLFNKTTGNTTNLGAPVMVGWWDPANSKVLVSIGTDGIAGAGLYYRKLNITGGAHGNIVPGAPADPGEVQAASVYFNFTWNISYGGASAVVDQQLLTFNVSLFRNYTKPSQSFISNFTIGTGSKLDASSGSSLRIDFRNKSAWTSTTTIPDFRLGSADSAEELDITSPQTDLDGTQAYQSIGKATQDIVSDGGIVSVSPSSYSGGQKVVVKIPAESLKVKSYVGKLGGTTTSSSTYNKIEPVKAAVAKLASEAGTGSAARSKNLVLVGGPCANSLVQELVDAGKVGATFTCKNGNIGAGWTKGTAYIWAIDGAFTTGKIAIVVAGTDAADTRLATSVLQNYDHSNVKSKLTGTGIKITGTEVATATISAA